MPILSKLAMEKSTVFYSYFFLNCVFSRINKNDEGRYHLSVLVSKNTPSTLAKVFTNIGTRHSSLGITQMIKKIGRAHV